MDISAAVDVQGLRYSYTPNKKRKDDFSVAEVLQGLSFSIQPNKITGLLGPNGSGKSTTFKILSTQIQAAAGTAKIFGLDASTQREEVRRLMGVTFQAPSLDPLLSVYENLKTFAALYGLSHEVAQKRITELLGVFQLADRAESKIKELSGGLARRVELAKALLPNPKLLMLDEPTTGLDPKLRREFWKELARLRDRGMTILVTTHLMDEAELCDELVFITEGKFAGQGAPDTLKKEFGYDLVEMRFKSGLGIGDETMLSEQIQSLLLPEERLRVEDHTARVETKRAMTLLNLGAEKLGASLQNISWGRPTLSDVYFAKTGKNL